MKIMHMAAIVAVLVLRLSAHHSFAAEYDSPKPVFLQGQVTKIEWMSPHTRFYLDVKNDKGSVTNWEMEMGSPNGLMRQGWSRPAMKIGDIVNVEAYAAKDESNLGNVRRVKLTDGRRLFAGSSNDGSPQP